MARCIVGSTLNITNGCFEAYIIVTCAIKISYKYQTVNCVSLALFLPSRSAMSFGAEQNCALNEKDHKKTRSFSSDIDQCTDWL